MRQTHICLKLTVAGNVLHICVSATQMIGPIKTKQVALSDAPASN